MLEASDEEHGDLNRLTLLAALRGLESFDGPATLTLLSVNRYLIRSLTDSLKRWRENGFVWEHYGRQIDVQHADLWRRIDRTLQIHRVDACLVSRRTVSAGTKGEPSNSLGPDRHLRFDRPTNPVRRPNFDRAMKKTGEVADPPTDRLRSWLLGIGEESPEHMRSPRRRATDLFELT